MEEEQESPNMLSVRNLNTITVSPARPVRRQSPFWDFRKTNLLISYFKAYCGKVKQCKLTFKKMWKIIAEKMKSEHNIKFTSDVLENRWRVLIRKYRKMKANEADSSKRTMMFLFQKKLDDVFKQISIIEDTFQNQPLDVSTLSEVETDPFVLDNEPLYNYVTWDPFSTKCLIKCWKFYRPKVLNKVINTKEMWNLIAEKLKTDYNLDFSNTCCENRARVLKRSYGNFLQGTRQKYFEYEREMKALYNCETKNMDLSDYHTLSSKHNIEASTTDISDTELNSIPEDRLELYSKSFNGYKIWDSKATKLLLHFYKQLHPKIGTDYIKNNKKMWETISSKLKEYKLNYSSNACENRWRVLLRNYEAVHRGKRRKFFEFTSDMNEICGKDFFKIAYPPKPTKVETVTSNPFMEIKESDTSSYANLRKYFQISQQKKLAAAKQLLEQSRRRNLLLEEKNKVLRQFIAAIANPFHSDTK